MIYLWLITSLISYISLIIMIVIYHDPHIIIYHIMIISYIPIDDTKSYNFSRLRMVQCDPTSRSEVQNPVASSDTSWCPFPPSCVGFFQLP